MHLDIKPENILITEARNAKLSDFGLHCEGNADKQKGELRTPAGLTYQSPECFANPLIVGFKQDSWNYGQSFDEIILAQKMFTPLYCENVEVEIYMKELTKEKLKQNIERSFEDYLPSYTKHMAVIIQAMNVSVDFRPSMEALRRSFIGMRNIGFISPEFQVGSDLEELLKVKDREIAKLHKDYNKAYLYWEDRNRRMLSEQQDKREQLLNEKDEFLKDKAELLRQLKEARDLNAMFDVVPKNSASAVTSQNGVMILTSSLTKGPSEILAGHMEDRNAPAEKSVDTQGFVPFPDGVMSYDVPASEFSLFQNVDSTVGDVASKDNVPNSGGNANEIAIGLQPGTLLQGNNGAMDLSVFQNIDSTVGNVASKDNVPNSGGNANGNAIEIQSGTLIQCNNGAMGLSAGEVTIEALPISNGENICVGGCSSEYQNLLDPVVDDYDIGENSLPDGPSMVPNSGQLNLPKIPEIATISLQPELPKASKNNLPKLKPFGVRFKRIIANARKEQPNLFYKKPKRTSGEPAHLKKGSPSKKSKESVTSQAAPVTLSITLDPKVGNETEIGAAQLTSNLSSVNSKGDLVDLHREAEAGSDVSLQNFLLHGDLENMEARKSVLEYLKPHSKATAPWELAYLVENFGPEVKLTSATEEVQSYLCNSGNGIVCKQEKYLLLSCYVLAGSYSKAHSLYAKCKGKRTEHACEKKLPKWCKMIKSGNTPFAELLHEGMGSNDTTELEIVEDLCVEPASKTIVLDEASEKDEAQNVAMEKDAMQLAMEAAIEGIDMGDDETDSSERADPPSYKDYGNEIKGSNYKVRSAYYKKLNIKASNVGAWEYANSLTGYKVTENAKRFREWFKTKQCMTRIPEKEKDFAFACLVISPTVSSATQLYKRGGGKRATDERFLSWVVPLITGKK